LTLGNSVVWAIILRRVLLLWNVG
jgi:hypothetical protein